MKCTLVTFCAEKQVHETRAGAKYQSDASFQEWIPSTPKHMALYKAFKWTAPKYAHMPILVNADGTKLSKRSGDVKVLDYIVRLHGPVVICIC